MANLTVDVLDPAGKKSGTAELPASIFDAQTNVALIHQVVIAQQAAARQGTHKTKTRGEVSGGGKKPWKQKGTGRARQGSTRAPQWTGGGVVHGPVPRDYSQRTPKKMKAAALRGALSDRARHGRIHVVSALLEGTAPSTKAARATLGHVSDRPRLLVVVDRSDDLGALSSRNLPTAHVLYADQLNTYDVMRADDVVFTTDALEAFVARATVALPTSSFAAARAEERAAQQPAASAEKPAASAEKPAASAEKPAASAEKPAAPAASAEKPAASAEKPAAPTEKPAAGEAPYGEGSALPLQDGSAPEGFVIKGNKDSMKYHTEDSPWFGRTKAEVWFATPEAAEAAGFVNAVRASAEEESK